MAQSAYRKLGDLAEKAMKDPGLSDVFKSGDEARIRAELAARGFTEADIDTLGRAHRALAPERRQAEELRFWIWVVPDRGAPTE